MFKSIKTMILILKQSIISFSTCSYQRFSKLYVSRQCWQVMATPLRMSISKGLAESAVVAKAPQRLSFSVGKFMEVGARNGKKPPWNLMRPICFTCFCSRKVSFFEGGWVLKIPPAPGSGRGGGGPPAIDHMARVNTSHKVGGWTSQQRHRVTGPIEVQNIYDFMALRPKSQNLQCPTPRIRLSQIDLGMVFFRQKLVYG